MSDVGAVADALTEVLKFTDGLINPSLQIQINRLQTKANEDCQNMVNNLTISNWPYVQLAFDGLPKLIPVSISESQLPVLRGGRPPAVFTNYDLLGCYCLARSAQLEKDILQLVQSQPKAG